MKKIFLLAFAALAVTQAYSQAINLDSVRTAVTDPVYYDSICRAFCAEMIASEDLVNLYYGHAFQPNYSPYDFFMCEKAVNDLIGQNKLEDALSLSLGFFQDRPGYLPVVYNLAVVCKMLGTPDNITEQADMRVGLLLGAITSSGNGKSKETAFVVTSVKDEYMLMQIFLQADMTSQTLLEDEENGRYYDVIEVVPNERYDSDKIYFDITLPYTHLHKK